MHMTPARVSLPSQYYSFSFLSCNKGQEEDKQGKQTSGKWNTRITGEQKLRLQSFIVTPKFSKEEMFLKLV